MSVAAASAPAVAWHAVCALDDILPDTGVCALIGDRQIAVYRWGDGDTLYALGNWDPIGRAFVMSRGILGSSGSAPKVASPLYKQSYDLRTGVCLDDATQRLPVFAVRCRGGRVEIAC